MKYTNNERHIRMKQFSAMVLTVLLAGSGLLALVPSAAAVITIDDVQPPNLTSTSTGSTLPMSANVSGIESASVTVDSSTQWIAGSMDPTLIVGLGGTLQLRRIDRDDFGTGNVPDSNIWQVGDYADVSGGVVTLSSDTLGGITRPYISMQPSQGGFDLSTMTDFSAESTATFNTLTAYTMAYGIGFTDGMGEYFGVTMQEDGNGAGTMWIDFFYCEYYYDCYWGGVTINEGLGNPAKVRAVVVDGSTGEITGDWWDAGNATWVNLGSFFTDFSTWTGPWTVFAGSMLDLNFGDDYLLDIDYIALDTTLYASEGWYTSEMLPTGLYKGSFVDLINLTTNDAGLNGIADVYMQTAPSDQGPWSGFADVSINTPLSLPGDAWIQFQILLQRTATPSWPDAITFEMSYRTEVGAFWVDDFAPGPSGQINPDSWTISSGTTNSEGLYLSSADPSPSIGLTYSNTTWPLDDNHNVEGIVALRAVLGSTESGGGIGDNNVLLPGFISLDGNGAIIWGVGVVRTQTAPSSPMYWGISAGPNGSPTITIDTANEIMTDNQVLVRFQLRNGDFQAWVLEIENPGRGWLYLGSVAYSITTGTTSLRIGDTGGHGGGFGLPQSIVVDWAALLVKWMNPGTPYTAGQLTLNEDENTRAVIALSGPTFAMETVTYRIDTIPPVGTFSLNGAIGYSTSVVVPIQLSATDRYGVAEFAASESLSFPEGWQAYSTSSTFYLTPEDGRHVVWMKFRDTSGVESQPINQSIILDQVDPTGAVYLNNRSAYANSPNVNLTILAFDGGGISGAWVSNNADLTGAVFVNLKVNGTGLPAVSTTVPWTLAAGDGLKTVYTKLGDIYSRTSHEPFYNDSILVDTTAPSLTATLPGSVMIQGTTYLNTSHAVVHVEAADASGVSRVDISQSATFADAVSYTGPGDLTFDLPEASGARTLYVRATDIYGLVSASTHLDFFVDVNAPVGSVTIDSGGLVVKSRSVTLQINATDNVAVADMMLSTSLYFPGAVWQPFASTATIELSTGDGTGKTVYARFRDVNGRVSQAFLDTIDMDTTIPTGFIIINNGDLVTTDRNLNLALQAYDNFAGQLEVRLSLTPTFENSTWLPFTDTVRFDARTVEGNVTVYYQVRDANQWESIVYSDSIRVRPATCADTNTCPPLTQPGFDGAYAAIAITLVGVAALVGRRKRAV